LPRRAVQTPGLDGQRRLEHQAIARIVIRERDRVCEDQGEKRAGERPPDLGVPPVDHDRRQKEDLGRGPEDAEEIRRRRRSQE
jgi:hypothetical protein